MYLCARVSMAGSAKCGEWQMALKLFDSLHKAGLKPDKGTYSAAVLACFKGHQVGPHVTGCCSPTDEHSCLFGRRACLSVMRWTASSFICWKYRIKGEFNFLGTKSSYPRILFYFIIIIFF